MLHAFTVPNVRPRCLVYEVGDEVAFGVWFVKTLHPTFGTCKWALGLGALPWECVLAGIVNGQRYLHEARSAVARIKCLSR